MWAGQACMRAQYGVVQLMLQRTEGLGCVGRMVGGA